MTEMQTNANIEKTRKKHTKGAPSAANKGKVKRRMKADRHLSEKKYMSRGAKRHSNSPQRKKTSKRLLNLLDGIPS